MSIVIQGAGRGLGLALAKCAAASGGAQNLILTARNPAASEGYRALPPSDSCTWVALDYECEESIAKAGAHIVDAAGKEKIARVVSTAGLLHDATTGLSPEKQIGEVQHDTLHRVFQVNAFGAILFAKALWPALKGRHNVTVAAVSARVGSVSDNAIGGWYAYRASKAALNQLLRTFSIELKRFNRHSCVAALHPGTVDTNLSEPFQTNVPDGKLFSAEYSAESLWKVLDSLTPEQTGNFFAYDGETIAY
eukprot:TRINITY_DN10906_c0_g1_i1.p1 TRINITY_DN10906_c0_g1~~TRINITY_DN10906_c0_g1_i1.p1  ORF type:complete len:250 (-),score=59.14 TRINITY_DN10906_c0_g1_i1:92-841(-)